MSGAMVRYPSPLRYPGGKGKLANYIKLVLIDNDLIGVDYVEPYAGGASVALSLLFEDFASHIFINDINPGIHAFWKAVLHNTDALCERIDKTPVTVDEWLHQKTIQKISDPDSFDLAFSTFFLNRTNRSGIVSGGVIGGLDQTGPWKMDARYNKPELIRRIRKIGRYRNRITLACLDASQLLQHWVARNVSRSAFFYLDPPYYVKGEGLYDNFYSHDDHVAITGLVTQLPHPWLVSYDAVPQITHLYTGAPSIRYSLGYSAAGSSQGSEIMFFSADLAIPDERPSGVRLGQVDQARQIAFHRGI